MKNIIKKLGFLILLVVTACDLDGDLENPNQITPSGADVDLIMNEIQVNFSNFFSGAQSAVNPLVRMEAMTAGFRYQTANTPAGVDGIWSDAYQGVLVNSELAIKLAEEKGLTTHVAVAKILDAYVYMTLVDIFGDVPRTEALKAETGNFNPIADGGNDIYNYAITLLTEARTELAKTGTDAGLPMTRDIFYPTSATNFTADRTKWTALANTLELKAWVNLRGVRQAEADAKINSLLSSNLIDTPAENFTYRYGTATNPVSRHPLYRQYYTPVEGNAGGYIANYFLYELYQGKRDPSDATIIVQDPRWRYYFYRQVGSIAKALELEPKALGCTPGAVPDHYLAASVPMYCVFDPGFYGRDHGDGFGIPPDGKFVTAAGVYPAGGKIDNTSTGNANFFDDTKETDGANGAGILPIWMSFYTDFLKAEILATNNLDAKAAMISGITNSITDIRAFATAKAQVLSAGREPSTTSYIAAVDALYTNATVKLDVVSKEFYIALWGNGIEAYNLVRRTGAPRDLQPTLQINPGPFYRSYVYPSSYVNLNDNAAQKDLNATNRVFWDVNPDVIN